MKTLTKKKNKKDGIIQLNQQISKQLVLEEVIENSQEESLPPVELNEDDLENALND